MQKNAASQSHVFIAHLREDGISKTIRQYVEGSAEKAGTFSLRNSEI